MLQRRFSLCGNEVADMKIHRDRSPKGKPGLLALLPANSFSAMAQKHTKRKKRKSGTRPRLFSRNRFWTVLLWIVFLPVLLFLGVGIVLVIIWSF